MSTTTVADVRAIARRGYANASVVERALAWARPSICPFHVLADQIPADTQTLLDIGCGTGLFLNLLASQGKIARGIGLDVSKRAIASARIAAESLAAAAQLQFQHHDLAVGLPQEHFAVVSMIDVMHHVPPAEQRAALASALSRVASGGLLVYKDMVRTPRWQAWMNRLHDLVLARQWIHYLPLAQVLASAQAAGFAPVHQERIDNIWYGHELVVFRRH